MNVNLHRDLDFLAGFYIPSFSKYKLQCNRYRVRLHLVTNTENFDEVNIAMDRVKALIYHELSHTVFVNAKHRDDISSLASLGINITTLPEEPLDQVISIMLYCKLNAIMEQRMQVTQIDIASELGDMVWYQHYADDNIGPFADSGWWHHASAQHTDVIVSGDGEIPMIPTGSWAHYDLSWPTDQEKKSTVVYANFRADEN